MGLLKNKQHCKQHWYFKSQRQSPGSVSSVALVGYGELKQYQTKNETQSSLWFRSLLL